MFRREFALMPGLVRGVAAGDRDRAPGSLLREAQNMLTPARGEADPQRRRELGRSALAKGREAVGHREVTDQNVRRGAR